MLYKVIGGGDSPPLTGQGRLCVCRLESVGYQHVGCLGRSQTEKGKWEVNPAQPGNTTVKGRVLGFLPRIGQECSHKNVILNETYNLDAGALALNGNDDDEYHFINLNNYSVSDESTRRHRNHMTVCSTSHGW